MFQPAHIWIIARYWIAPAPAPAMALAMVPALILAQHPVIYHIKNFCQDPLHIINDKSECGRNLCSRQTIYLQESTLLTNHLCKHFSIYEISTNLFYHSYLIINYHPKCLNSLYSTVFQKWISDGTQIFAARYRRSFIMLNLVSGLY